MKEYFGIILFSLLSSCLIFVAKNDVAIQWLIDSNILSADFDRSNFQMGCFLFGIAWAGLWLPIRHILLKNRFKRKTEDFHELLEFHKDAQFELVKEKIKEYNTAFSTRVFVPKKGVKGWFDRTFNSKIVLCLKKVKGISDSFPHDSLLFEVNQSCAQGMVGKSFKTKALCIDLDVSENSYELTESHKTKIGDVEFCATIPIFNKDESNIRAILSVDSKKRMIFDAEKKKQWESHMKYYAAFVDKHTTF